MNQVNAPSYESLTVAGAAGAQIQYWLLKPPNFDASKKYPTVFMIHGGGDTPQTSPPADRGTTTPRDATPRDRGNWRDRVDRPSSDPKPPATTATPAPPRDRSVNRDNWRGRSSNDGAKQFCNCSPCDWQKPSPHVSYCCANWPRSFGRKPTVARS